MDSLLGVVLVAQFPAEPADVVFQHPQQSSIAAQHAGAASSLQSQMMTMASSTEDMRAKSKECFGIPTVSFAKLMVPEEMLCNRQLIIEFDAGNLVTLHEHGRFGHILLVSFPCSVAEFSGSSSNSGIYGDIAGDWDIENKAVGGSTSSHTKVRIFKNGLVAWPELVYQHARPAQLQVVEEDGWQFLLDGYCIFKGERDKQVQVRLRVDAGELKLRQSTAGESVEVAGKNKLPHLHRVQRFNIVHVIDGTRTKAREPQTANLWHVSAHLSRALVCEEVRAQYLSTEIRKILQFHRDADFADEDTSSKAISARSSLAGLLVDMYAGVRAKGYKSLVVNNHISCQVCVFAKPDPLPDAPSADAAMALTCQVEELEAELPPDSASVVLEVVRAANPALSLGDLVSELGLPLPTLQRIALHLEFWRKARIVDVFLPTTRVAITLGLDTSRDSVVARKFHKSVVKRKSGQNSELTFSEVIVAFSDGKQLQEVQEKLFGSNARELKDQAVSKVAFDRLLAWLVAEGVLVQLAVFYHFFPHRAVETRQGPRSLRSRYVGASRLSCQEFEALAAHRSRVRSSDAELELLCRFALLFVRRHARTDGTKFEAFAASLKFSADDALRIIDSNNHILVPYVCPC